MLLSVAEVASYTGLSESAIRRAIQDGELPAHKLRSRVRISEDALRVWVHQNQIENEVRHWDMVHQRLARIPHGSLRALCR